MMCICCDKRISLINWDGKDKQGEEMDEEKIVFEKRKRQVYDKQTSDFDKEITLDATSEMWNSGVVGKIEAGYGSRHDFDQFVIAICDDCLEKKKLQGVVAYTGGYMSTPDDFEKSRIAWRRYNRIDDLLSDD